MFVCVCVCVYVCVCICLCVCVCMQEAGVAEKGRSCKQEFSIILYRQFVRDREERYRKKEKWRKEEKEK